MEASSVTSSGTAEWSGKLSTSIEILHQQLTVLVTREMGWLHGNHWEKKIGFNPDFIGTLKTLKQNFQNTRFLYRKLQQYPSIIDLIDECILARNRLCHQELKNIESFIAAIGVLYELAELLEFNDAADQIRQILASRGVTTPPVSGIIKSTEQITLEKKRFKPVKYKSKKAKDKAAVANYLQNSNSTSLSYSGAPLPIAFPPHLLSIAFDTIAIQKLRNPNLTKHQFYLQRQQARSDIHAIVKHAAPHIPVHVSFQQAHYNYTQSQASACPPRHENNNTPSSLAQTPQSQANSSLPKHIERPHAIHIQSPASAKSPKQNNTSSPSLAQTNAGSILNNTSPSVIKPHAIFAQSLAKTCLPRQNNTSPSLTQPHETSSALAHTQIHSTPLDSGLSFACTLISAYYCADLLSERIQKHLLPFFLRTRILSYPVALFLLWKLSERTNATVAKLLRNILGIQESLNVFTRYILILLLYYYRKKIGGI